MIKGGRFEALDGMRGFASMAVVAYHIGLALKLPSYLVVRGDIAVDFFFALSGFVLMHANGTALASGRLSGARFMALRIARHWPMVVLGAAIAACSYALTSQALPVDRYVDRSARATLRSLFAAHSPRPASQES